MFFRQHQTFFFTLALFLLSGELFAQHGQENAGNLRLQIKQAATDSARISKIISLGLYYVQREPSSSRNPDSSMYLGNEALRQSEGIKDNMKRGFSYDLISKAYIGRGQTQEGFAAERNAIRSFAEAQNDDALGYAYKQLAGYYSYSNEKDLVQRISYTDTSLQYYQKSNNKKKVGETYQELGNLSSLHNQQFLAIRYLKEGITVFNSIGYKPQQSLFYMLNECYNQIGDYKQAISYGLKALQLSDANGDASGERCAILNHVGITYKNMGQYSKSAEYFKEGLLTAKKQHNKDAYEVVAINYSGALIALNRVWEAIALLRTVKPGKDFEKATVLYSIFLRAYAQLKNFDMASSYYSKLEEAMSNIDKMSFIRELANTNIVFYLFQRGDFDDARKLLYELQSLSNYHLSKATQVMNEHWLFRIDSAQGKYLSAIKHIQTERKLQNSLLDEEKNRNISQLEVQYQTEEKERELRLKSQSIEILTKQGQLQEARLKNAALIWNVTIGGIVMLLLLLGLGYNRYQIKQRNNIQLREQQDIIEQKNEVLKELVDEKDELLTEKEWLLKEIHHRVKNNLQIVISLLNSQSICLENQEALAAIRESQHRMQSISLIHQKLYQSEDLAKIDMNEYVSELVNYLQESFDISGRIRINLEIEPIALDVVQAVPIGLILNEALTNAIKYAFSGCAYPVITVNLDEPLPGELVLRIADNGCGLDPNFNIERSTSLGMNLIKGLCRQLHGTFEIKNAGGVVITIAITGFSGQPADAERRFSLTNESGVAEL